MAILDPQAEHLPRRAGGAHRPSGTRINLRKLRPGHLEGHLKPFEYIKFGFDRESTFKGTIFRLPLRKVASQLSDRTFGPIDLNNLLQHFKATAASSFFFTNSLQTVTAIRRRAQGDTESLWSVSGIKAPVENDAQADIFGSIPVASTVCLKIESRNEDPRTENWRTLEVKFEEVVLPEHLREVLHTHELPSITLGLAAQVDKKNFGERQIFKGSLHSTLPLPIQLDLPVHLNAHFVIANDRRTVRYDVHQGCVHFIRLRSSC